MTPTASIFGRGNPCGCFGDMLSKSLMDQLVALVAGRPDGLPLRDLEALAGVSAKVATEEIEALIAQGRLERRRGRLFLPRPRQMAIPGLENDEGAPRGGA